MKKVLFGIALILFAVVLLLSGIWLPVISDLMDRTEFAVLVAAIGLVIAGIGALPASSTPRPWSISSTPTAASP